jgi:nifR3 family TIM-barrel protein
MKKIWDRLPKNFFCLAPMSDVTDPAFRSVIAKYSKTGKNNNLVFWTEFVSADGLASPGRDVLKNNLIFSKKEKPIIAQLFGADPKKIRKASSFVATLGFDGIDINMGCPDRAVERQGAGSSLIKNPNLAGLLIEAVKDGIKDSGRKNISVSVKTRIGYNKDQIDEWIPFLLSCGLDALTLHARTRKQLSKVPADWSYIKRAVSIRNKMGIKTKIIGNGDVDSLGKACELIKETGCDGVMVGRGIFGNPWFFNPSKKKIKIEEKLKVLVEHTKLFEKLEGHYRNFAVMKKHYKAYVNDFSGAKELRLKLMEANNAKEVEKIISDFLSKK